MKIAKPFPFGPQLAPFIVFAFGKKGWLKPRTVRNPRVGLLTHALHYGAAVFEGQHAEIDRRQGKAFLFRPDDHYSRLLDSCMRMCLPIISQQMFDEAETAMMQLVYQSGSYDGPVYLRPHIFSGEETLGFKSHSGDAYYFVLSAHTLASDIAKKGVAQVHTGGEVRTWPGGTGKIKSIANYAAARSAEKLAEKEGHTAVLWQSPIGFAQEFSTANLFFVRKRGEVTELVTPSLHDTILPGITRATILEIAQKCDIAVKEEDVQVEYMLDMIQGGLILEVFATGTAIIAQPMQALVRNGTRYDLPENTPIALELFQKMQNVYKGKLYPTYTRAVTLI